MKFHVIFLVSFSFNYLDAPFSDFYIKGARTCVTHDYMSIYGRKSTLVETVGEASWEFISDCVTLVCFVGDVSAALFQAITHPRKVRWKETFYYMDMCGANALPITGIICLLMGLILALQAAVQLRKFGSELLVADLVGTSIVKELGPLMVAMIATGRAGSSFAAEIGTMKVNEEIDAMTTMGFVPTRFVVVPKIIAMFTVMPLLCVFGDVVGVLGGMLIGVTYLKIPIVTYYTRTVNAITYMYFFEGIIKSLVFAVLIAGVGCMRGMESSNDAQGVGRSATSAVVSGIFLIVVADMIFTFLFTI